MARAIRNEARNGTGMETGSRVTGPRVCRVIAILGVPETITTLADATIRPEVSDAWAGTENRRRSLGQNVRDNDRILVPARLWVSFGSA